MPPPDPNRLAMIWVTHDLLPYDRGEPGGPVEMTRMMCFQFANGSGGSEWPVDAARQPPGSDSDLADEGVRGSPFLFLCSLPSPLVGSYLQHRWQLSGKGEAEPIDDRIGFMATL